MGPHRFCPDSSAAASVKLREHRGHAGCRRDHDLLVERLTDVDAQIRELRDLRATLDQRRRAREQALDDGGERS